MMADETTGTGHKNSDVVRYHVASLLNGNGLEMLRERCSERSLVSADTAKYRRHSAQQDGNVEKDIAVPDVEEVELQVLVDRHCTRRADLPQTGDSRSDVKPQPLAGVVALHNERHLRA